MIWITWECQRRNYSLSAALGAELYVFDYKNRTPFFRYILSSFRTILLFAKDEKNYFVQNPSIVLATLAVIIRKTFRRDIILFVDTHNAGLFPFDGRYRLFNWISRLIVTNADYVIVTNSALASIVTDWGGKSVIAEDPLPNIVTEHVPAMEVGTKNILYICSYAEDEPYMEVVNACFLLDKNIIIYMTGKVGEGVFGENVLFPPNVVVTDFISQDHFDGLLLMVDCVMVLTTRENCLVCGGYEAVAAGKPLILSDTSALRSFFCKGAVYCKNDSLSIADSIVDLFNDFDRYTGDIVDLGIEMKLNWMKRKDFIFGLIDKY